MSINKSEFLSALLDDEAGSFERRRILDELKQNEVLAGQLSRYALIGEALRAGTRPTAVAPRQFLEGIQASIAAEDALHIQAANEVVASQTSRSWLQYGRYGVAASVGALCAMFVLAQLNPSSTSTPTTILSSANPNPQITPLNPSSSAIASTEKKAMGSSSNLAMSERVRPMSRIDPKTRALLKEYIAEHVRYASTTAVVPTVRAVSYEQ